MNTQSQNITQECNDLLKQGPDACIAALHAELFAIAVTSSRPKLCILLATNKAMETVTKLTDRHIPLPVAIISLITSLRTLHNKSLALRWVLGELELEVTEEQDTNNSEQVVFLHKWVRVEKQNNLNSANNLQ